MSLRFPSVLKVQSVLGGELCKRADKKKPTLKFLMTSRELPLIDFFHQVVR